MHLGTIIIIEDDVKVGEIIRLGLSNNTSGYDIILTNNGRTGVNKAKTQWTPFVIIDYYLPDIDGVEVTRRIKKVSPQTKVLMISGATDSRVLESISGAGADHFLSKPFTVTELMVHVRELLGLSFVQELQ